MTQRLRPYLIGAVLIIVGVIVGYSLPSNSVSPKSEIGVVQVVRGNLHPLHRAWRSFEDRFLPHRGRGVILRPEIDHGWFRLRRSFDYKFRVACAARADNAGAFTGTVHESQSVPG